MEEFEIIKILKDTISLFNNDIYCVAHDVKEIVEAIQGIIELYEKEKKENKAIKEEIEDWKFTAKFVEDNYVDKIKIKALIDKIHVDGYTCQDCIGNIIELL